MNESTIDVVARKQLSDAAQVIGAVALRLQALLDRIVALEQRVAELERQLGTEPETAHVES